jgi:hypothetical protein
MPEQTTRLGHLVLLLAGFLVIGGPLALVIWRELSELLLGRVHPGPLAMAAALLVVFVWLAARLGRSLQRLGGGP